MGIFTGLQKRVLRTSLKKPTTTASIADVKNEALKKAVAGVGVSGSRWQTPPSTLSGTSWTQGPGTPVADTKIETPTQFSEMIRTKLNERIANEQMNFAPKIASAYDTAMKGADISGDSDYGQMTIGAMLNREGVRNQGLLTEANQLSSLQQVMSGRVDNSLNAAANIMNEKNQLEAQRAQEERLARQEEYNRQRDLIEDQRNQRLLELQEQSLQNEVTTQEYNLQKDKIEAEREELKMQIDMEQAQYDRDEAESNKTSDYRKEVADALKAVKRDEYGELPPEANALLELYGITVPKPGEVASEIEGTVVKSTAGKVRRAGGPRTDSVTVRGADGQERTYTGLSNVAVKPGEQITLGSILGTQTAMAAETAGTGAPTESDIYNKHFNDLSYLPADQRKDEAFKRTEAELAEIKSKTDFGVGALAGNFENAVRNAMRGKGEKIIENEVNRLNAYLQAGDIPKARSMVMTILKDQMGSTKWAEFAQLKKSVTDMKDIKEKIVKLEEDIQQFNSTKDQWTPPRLGLGPFRDVLMGPRLFFNAEDSDIVKLQNQMARAFQEYRKAMTGAVFSKQESGQYEALFPQVYKHSQQNIDNIDELLSTLQRTRDNLITEYTGGAFSSEEDFYNQFEKYKQAVQQPQLLENGQTGKPATSGWRSLSGLQDYTNLDDVVRTAVEAQMPPVQTNESEPDFINL